MEKEAILIQRPEKGVPDDPVLCSQLMNTHSGLLYLWEVMLIVINHIYLEICLLLDLASLIFLFF